MFFGMNAGIAPGLVSGALQINVRVPERASNGGLILRVGERESQEGVIVPLMNQHKWNAIQKSRMHF